MQSIAMFERDLEANLENLSTELRRGSYCPSVVKRVWIPKAGKNERRPLGIPTVRDRVAQTALRSVLEPIFEREFSEHSYGFRPKRGCKDALRRVDSLLNAGYTWVVDADLKSYFDTIPHEPLMARVKEKVADGRVLKLIEQYLHQKVMDGMDRWEPESGSPQGAVISPLLSNIYLDPLDKRMAAAGIEMVRYADDFVLLCRSEDEARNALARVREWTAQAGLTMHPEKTRIVDAAQAGGFDFLGYHFEKGQHWPGRKALKKIKDALRERTRRNNGQSLGAIIAKLNPVLRGWFEYYKHSLRNRLESLDSWLRRRLRSILRRRAGGYGISSGGEQKKWPNVYFRNAGLLNLTAAHRDACQSLKR
jgi:RNA-directed DNA polymerase